MVSSDADRIRSAIPTTLDRRAQGKALSDLVRRLWERQLKRDELEAAEAVASVAEDDGEAADALRAMTDDMKTNSRRASNRSAPSNPATGTGTTAMPNLTTPQAASELEEKA